LASEPPTVPPWPGIPPHKPLLSSAVKFKREPGLAPHEHRRRRLVATATHTGCPAPRPKRSGGLALAAHRVPGLAGPLRPRAPRCALRHRPFGLETHRPKERIRTPNRPDVDRILTRVFAFINTFLRRGPNRTASGPNRTASRKTGRQGLGHELSW
jgi:hypothetical protein